MAQPTMPDQSSFKGPLRTDAEPGVIGIYDALTQTGKPIGHPDAAQHGGLVYGESERRGAWSLFTANLRAFFDDPAPYKVAEETQIAQITYAETIVKGQDPRRMNQAQYEANIARQRGPKVSERPSTGAILANLSGGPNSLESDDSSILALLGIQ